MTMQRRTRAYVFGAIVSLVSSGVVAIPIAASAASMPGTREAATLPEVTMTCRTGQSDINHATVDELRAALAVDTPVAQRVVAWRPFLSPKDLAVVEGIGPGKLAAILASNNSCATPTSYPPPSQDACLDDKVDLAAAPLSQLMSRLGVTQPIAQRIIDARPYASLRHVTPERVGGIGKGTLDKVVAKSCLTPTPVRSATNSWRWAYKSQTTTATRDKFALTVPSGVVDGAGGWASVTPVDNSQVADTPEGPLVTRDAPSADFHIWAAWQGGGDTVTVQLPQDVILAESPAWVPVLIHHKSDGTQDGAWGSAVVWDKAAGTVATSQSSLSETESSSFNPSWFLEKAISLVFGGRTDEPSCNNQWSPQADAAWYENPSYHDLARVRSWMLNVPGSPSLFGSYPFKHCLGSVVADGADVQTTLANNLRGMTSVRPLDGTTVVTKETNASEFVADPTGSILSEVFHNADPSAAFLIPGAKASFKTPIGHTSTVEATPERAATLAWFVSGEIFDELLNAGAAKLADTSLSRSELKLYLGCFRSITGTSNLDEATLGDVANAVAGCADPQKLIDYLQADLSDALRRGVTGINYSKSFTELKKVERGVKYLALGRAAITLVDTVAWGSLPDKSVTVDHYPAKPVSFKGYPVRAECLSQDFQNDSWMVDAACQDRFYAPATTPQTGSGTAGSKYPPGVILRNLAGAGNWLYLYPGSGEEVGRKYEISTGANYVCLAKHYVVDWAPGAQVYWTPLNRTFLNDFACDSADAGVDLTSAESGVDTDWRLLREPDGVSTVNRVWIPLADGKRAEVPSAHEFGCLVDPQPRQLNGGVWLNPPKYYIWDLVDPAAIVALRPTVVAYSFSNCTDGI
jgi:DNA uptake protein ComE-like DNA-binding protein